MNYEKIYNSLMQSRKSRGLDKSKLDFVTECHHILPTCLGGLDIDCNKVLLTPREHFVAHWLLTKFTSGLGYYKMLNALVSFQMLKEGRKLTSRQYETCRLAAAKCNAELVLNGNHNFQSEAFRSYKSDFQKQAVHCHCGMTGKRGGMGKAHGANCKYKPYMSLQLALIGIHASNYVSLIRYAEVYKTPTACPHCGKVGKGPMQLRWHFDNCKAKVD